MPDPTRGLFIVLEGGDGAGKTTVLAALAAWCVDHDIPALQTREPGGTPEGLALRHLLLAEHGTQWDARAELLLMTAARIQHVRAVIAPALAAGRTVLCDRFIASTLAYQGAGRGIDPALIATLHRECVDDLWPDLTLLLDIDPAQGLARSRTRLGQSSADEGKFEALTLDFHNRVRAAYLSLAQTRPNWVVIDSAQSPQAVIAAAAEQVKKARGSAPGIPH